MNGTKEEDDLLTSNLLKSNKTSLHINSTFYGASNEDNNLGQYCDANRDCWRTSTCCSTKRCVMGYSCISGLKIVNDYCDFGYECLSHCCVKNMCSIKYSCLEKCSYNSDCASNCCSQGVCTSTITCDGLKKMDDFCNHGSECLSGYCEKSTGKRHKVVDKKNSSES